MHEKLSFFHQVDAEQPEASADEKLSVLLTKTTNGVVSIRKASEGVVNHLQHGTEHFQILSKKVAGLTLAEQLIHSLNEEFAKLSIRQEAPSKKA